MRRSRVTFAIIEAAAMQYSLESPFTIVSASILMSLGRRFPSINA